MKPTKEESQANRAAKLEAAKAMLVTAVAALQTSEGWIKMLKALAANGRYSIRRLSFRNQLLVLIQHPARKVATFKAWIKAGRVVQKGQHAITILAPVIVKVTPKTGGEPESKCIGFRTHNVFAEDQTAPLPNAKPVEPEPDIKDFCRNVEDQESFNATVESFRDFAVASLKETIDGIDIRPRQPGDHPEAHGWFDPRTKRIVIVTGETSRTMQLKTLCHELGHATLGHGTGKERLSRSVEETEAESVAFLVCSALGIDSGSYSFGYVADWARKEDAEKLILASGQRIVTAANKILDAFEGSDAEDPEAEMAEAA